MKKQPRFNYALFPFRVRCDYFNGHQVFYYYKTREEAVASLNQKAIDLETFAACTLVAA